MQYDELHEFIAEKHNNIRGIVALRNGNTVYCDNWGGFTETDTVHVMSVTKSVVSILIGIARDMGLIESINQPVLEFFPDYKIKRGEKTIQSVTIDHLLTMTAPYKYRSEPWTKICSSDNWTTTTLDILGGRAGLTGSFRYSTLGIHILTGILAKVSGMSTVDFANKYLFEPIGVAPHKVYFALTAEDHKRFIISKESKGDIWFSDPQDIGTAGYGLCLSSADMARIGQLCLEGGSHNGKQIVSSEWLSESTTPNYQCGEDYMNMTYGRLWWIPDTKKSAFAALGDSGNVIYINPDNKTVISVASAFKPSVLEYLTFVREHIEPMLES